jgi:hypothetical protein
MRGCLLILALLSFLPRGLSQPAKWTGTDRQPPLRSGSGQFYISTAPVLVPSVARIETSTNDDVVVLTPGTLVSTCERVKTALLRELGLPDLWRGRIHLIINSAMPNNQPAAIVAKPFADGWQYQVELPAELERMKIVRSLVQVLLLEVANRQAGRRSAEVPLWLSEGLALQLARSSLPGVVVDPPRYQINNIAIGWQTRQAIRRDPLQESRDRLMTHTALSLQKLGELGAGELPEDLWRSYQASAQLLVSQLLVLPGGRAALDEFIFRLAICLNWQTAFLDAFRFQFPRMLDAEKWWSVVLVHFTGLDPMQAWSPSVAWTKLDETLRPPVLVHAAQRDLPQRRRTSLQDLVRDWDYLPQRLVLQGVATQLKTVRMRMPPEYVGLLDAYRQTLEGYLSRRDRVGMARSPAGAPSLAADHLVFAVLTQLDELDQQRQKLNPATRASAWSQIPGS